jgi:hypothetical protein
MDLAPIGYLYAMQTVKLRKKCVRVLLDVVVVVPQDLPEKFMFSVMYGFDDVLVVAREIKEAPAFSRGAELGKDVFAG